MAIAPLAALHRKLFDETDGSKFARLKERLLKKHAADERQDVLEILMAYARDADYAKTGKYEPEWLEKIEPSDFSLEGYEHHAPIKAAMAV